ncbi:MAG: hypothetical protein PGN12_06090 [Sphingomonas phyllosphaerae]
MSADEDPKAPAKFLGELLTTMTHEVALLTGEIAGALSDVALFGDALAAGEAGERLKAASNTLRDRADSMQRQLLTTMIKLSKVGGSDGVNIIPFPKKPGKDV